jgi:hypothetical protein
MSLRRSVIGSLRASVVPIGDTLHRSIDSPNVKGIPALSFIDPRSAPSGSRIPYSGITPEGQYPPCTSIQVLVSSESEVHLVLVP